MRTALKLGGFVAALAAMLAISFGIGHAVGPLGVSESSADPTSGHDATDGHDATADPPVGGDATGHGDVTPGGLTVSGHGYTLRPASTILPSGRTAVRFQIIGPDGRPVTRYEPTHDKDLHFIAVRRDTTGFQHVHPTLDSTGTWSTDIDLTPGVWRLFADFRPMDGARTLTLGVDASVAGPYDPAPLPPETRTAQVDDYAVVLTGELTPGAASELTLTVSRNGQPVTDLQPYLAAYGHLVALRVGDLAYLHVHPEGEPGDGVTPAGPDVTFVATAPSAGPYRLFLDFQHDGVVRTAEFTLSADSGSSDTSTPTVPSEGTGAGDDGDHGHS